MERASRSTRRPASMASSIPAMAYLSPVSTTSSPASEFPTATGLGISGCPGLETTVHSISGCSSEQHCSLSSTPPGLYMPFGNIYNAPLEADEFCGRTCYEIYNDIPVPSQSSAGYYETRPMDIGLGYNPGIGIAAGQDMLAGQIGGMPGLWPSTPVSEPSTPLQPTSITANQPINGQWDQGIHHDFNAVFHPQSKPHSEVFHPSIPLMGKDTAGNQPNREHEANLAPATSTPTTDRRAEAAPKSSKRGRKPSAEKGCRCPVCGFYFTRRSNCLAHQKKHDPNFQRSIPCDKCSKSFGRNADLRRHVDTVHRGIRKHVCKWCSRRYTRLENMVKHYAECNERPENERTPTPPPCLSEGDLGTVSPSR